MALGDTQSALRPPVVPLAPQSQPVVTPGFVLQGREAESTRAARVDQSNLALGQLNLARRQQADEERRQSVLLPLQARASEQQARMNEAALDPQVVAARKAQEIAAGTAAANMNPELEAKARDAMLQSKIFEAQAEPNNVKAKLQVMAEAGVSYPVDPSRGVSPDDLAKIDEMFGKVVRWKQEQTRARQFVDDVKIEPLDLKSSDGTTETESRTFLTTHKTLGVIPSDAMKRAEQFKAMPFALWDASGGPLFSPQVGAGAPAVMDTSGASAGTVQPRPGLSGDARPALGSRMGDGSIVTGSKRIMEQVSPDTSKKVDSLDSAFSLFNQLKQSYYKYKADRGYRDEWAPLLGRIDALNPWDVNAQAVKGAGNALIPIMARGVFDEVGVLSDTDIARYRSLLADTTDLRPKAEKLFSIVGEALNSKVLGLVNNHPNSTMAQVLIDKYGLTPEMLASARGNQAEMFRRNLVGDVQPVDTRTGGAAGPSAGAVKTMSGAPPARTPTMQWVKNAQGKGWFDPTSNTFWLMYPDGPQKPAVSPR